MELRPQSETEVPNVSSLNAQASFRTEETREVAAFPRENETEEMAPLLTTEAGEASVFTDPVQVGNLLGELRQETRKQGWRKGLLHVLVACLIIAAPIVATFACLFVSTTFPALTAWMLLLQWLAVCALIWLGSGVLYHRSGRLAATRRQREIEQEIAGLDAPEVIPSLLVAVQSDRNAEFPLLRRTLARLLNQVRPTEASLLPLSHRPALYDQLTIYAMNEASAELAIATLGALERIEDGKALPHIKRLADCNPWTPQQRQMQHAAETAYTRLYMRFHELQMRNVLVRAAETPTSGADVLVRPASSVGADTNPAELLRAETAYKSDHGTDS